MCVRVKKWREDAQPEWPEVASATQDIPTTGGHTQAFPETRETGVPYDAFSGAGETEVLRGGGRPVADADGTEVLASSADETDVLPRTERTTESRPAPVRDPWAESGPAGHAHDPHEVTVQLDAVSLRGDGGIERPAGGDGGSEGSDGPVFVDESGRRSRRFRRIGMAVGMACAVYAVVIVATLLSGNSNAPWLPVTGPKDNTPAGKVDTSPLPAESAAPSVSVGVTPGSTPTASDGTTPSPGASATAPGASTSPVQPGGSTDPDPTATETDTADPDPTDVDPTPTDTATVTPDPDPTATDDPDPSVTPTETTGDGTGTGSDNVADGPSSSSPIAEESSTAVPTDSPLSPSPENIL